MNEVAPLLPDIKNPMLAPHWEAAARGRLAIRFCVDCDAPQWPPRYNCLACHGFAFEWREVADRGELFTYFIARKALHPSLADDVPYATAAVVLPVGVKLLGRLVDIEPDGIRIGMPLRARYVPRSPDVTLVYWAPDTDGPDTDAPDTDGPDTDGPNEDGPNEDGAGMIHPRGKGL